MLIFKAKITTILLALILLLALMLNNSTRIGRNWRLYSNNTYAHH